MHAPTSFTTTAFDALDRSYAEGVLASSTSTSSTLPFPNPNFYRARVICRYRCQDSILIINLEGRAYVTEVHML